MLILPTTRIVDHPPRIGSLMGESVAPLCSGGEFAYARFVLGSERPRVLLYHDNLLDLSVAAERSCANNLADWARPSTPADSRQADPISLSRVRTSKTVAARRVRRPLHLSWHHVLWFVDGGVRADASPVRRRRAQRVHPGTATRPGCRRVVPTRSGRCRRQ